MKLLSLVLVFGVLADEYYRILGVDKNADEKTIRKSFKKLSLQFHPDRGNHETQDYYMKLSLAYEVLTNPAKREVYDKYGEEGITIGGLKYNVEEIYDNYFGQDYPGKFRWYNLMYQGSSVVEITEHTIHAFENRKEIWVLQFYGSKSKRSKEMNGMWRNLATRMEGVVKVAAVNCDVNENMCKDYNIKKYPVIVVFSDNKEEEHVLYTGEKTYRAINDFIIESLPGKIKILNQASFYQFLASEPQLPKILLFSENKEIWTTVKPAAKAFENKVLIGYLKDTEQELVQKFEIKSFPTLVAVVPNGHEAFEGGFFKLQIQDWIEKIISSHKPVSLAKEFDQAAYESGNCGKSDSKFCFIAFNPDPQMEEVLTELVVHFANDPVSVFWISEIKESNFFERFGGRNVIIRGKKNKFSVVECPSVDLNCFIEALSNSLAGSREFFPLKSEFHFSNNADL